MSGSPPRSPLGGFAAIAVVVVAGAAAFAYAGGFFPGDRLSPGSFIAALAPKGGPAPAHRRNHAKGICFTGSFQSNGAGATLSHAGVFAAGTYPLLGRFSIANAKADTPDLAAPVRGMAFRITTPDGEQWRSAMIDAPFFPAATPAAFRALLLASKSGDAHALGATVAAHPEIARFGAWAKTAPVTGSFADAQYNGLDAFIFTAADGTRHAVRWSLVPKATPTVLTKEQIAAAGPDILEREIATRVAEAPAQWTMRITIADPSDQTADPSAAWPDGRRQVDVGTVVLNRIEPDIDGPCRDVNFDPTVLPSGISLSDDPFPPARSAVYAVSYDQRSAEQAHLGHTIEGTTP